MENMRRYMRSNWSLFNAASSAASPSFLAAAVVIAILQTFWPARQTSPQNPRARGQSRERWLTFRLPLPRWEAERPPAAPVPAQAAYLSASCLHQTRLFPEAPRQMARDIAPSAMQWRCGSIRPQPFAAEFHFFPPAEPLQKTPASARRDWNWWRFSSPAPARFRPRT